ncbi:MAG TPA: hypothetical protein G4N93_05510 [Dehalococcoidia bacterium]|nr:hypothetical protein [Dehalococcoidia bacterium]
MITADQAFMSIPYGLRKPLIEEYGNIVNNYMERRWTPSELSGGRFCEVVYTILNGFSSGNYASSPMKPDNFVAACRRLETDASNPRSFQILIPRILPALYEIRNNRGVGHVGGDVDPNHIDASAVLSMTSWIMAELIRIFHNMPIHDAQKLADSLVDRRTPLVWQSGDIRRVLKPTMTMGNQILVLLSSCSTEIATADLLRWIEPTNRSYFYRLLRTMHSSRFIELSSDGTSIELLPPGTAIVEQLIIDMGQYTSQLD